MSVSPPGPRPCLGPISIAIKGPRERQRAIVPQLLFFLAALGLALFPVGVKAAGFGVEEARAVRLR